jgi:hypothetical protein
VLDGFKEDVSVLNLLEPLKAKPKLDPKLLPSFPEIVDDPKLLSPKFLDGEITLTNTLPSEPDTAKPKNSLVLRVKL